MKHYLFIFILLFSFALTMNAQDVEKGQVYYRYCYVNFKSKLGGYKIEITEGKGDEILSDKNGNEPLFETWVAALNYLSLEGWELVAHETINEEEDFEKNWLFKKVVSKEELQQRVKENTKYK